MRDLAIGHYIRTFTQHEILKMNWLDAQQFGEEQSDKVLEALRVKAEEEFSCTAERLPNEIKMLTTYHYKKYTGQTTDLSSPKKGAWVEQASGDSAKFAKALYCAFAACPMALDGSQEIAIKIENPKVVALREQLVILRSGNGALEKRLSEGREMEAVLSLASKSKVDVGLHTRRSTLS